MIRAAVFAAAVTLTSNALAGEHPKEHPTGAEHPAPKAATGKEHPKGHEHPVGSKHWNKQMFKEYTAAVESHVKTSPDGFPIKDAKLGKEWRLALLGVHKKRVVHLGDKKFFACADFKSLDSKDKLDLDFYASKTGDAWTIDEVLIHKVNGAPRYTYNDKNERVPVE